MLKKIYCFVFAALVLTITSTSILAQTQEEIKEVANRTAVIEKGLLKSMSLPIPGMGEQRFTFEWAEDGQSFTMISDNGERTQVFFNSDKEIQSVRLPNNEVAQISWEVVDGQNRPDLIAPRANCEAARQAMVDAVLAAGLACFIDQGPGCWAAVAFAGVMTARAYRACRGQ